MRGRLGGDRAQRLVVARQLRAAGEDQLDEQLEPLLPQRGRQRVRDVLQDRGRLAAPAAQREPRRQPARRVDAQRRVGRTPGETLEDALAVLEPGLDQRAPALELDGVELDAAPAARPARARAAAPPSGARRGDGPPRRRDAGRPRRPGPPVGARASGARRRAGRPRPPRSGAPPRARAARRRGRADALPRRHGDHGVGEGAHLRLEDSLVAQLGRGGDGVHRLEARERRRGRPGRRRPGRRRRAPGRWRRARAAPAGPPRAGRAAGAGGRRRTAPAPDRRPWRRPAGAARRGRAGCRG